MADGVIIGSLTNEYKFTGKLSSNGTLSGSISQSGGSGPPVPVYHGPYEVTPTQSTQTLHTSGYKLTHNVTVNPIPSNYGLITWNGSVLTVS